MFGLKKKKDSQRNDALSEEVSKFQVHTMQDDIDEINGTGKSSKTASVGSILDANQESPKSPFFGDASTSAQTQPIPKSSPWKSAEKSPKDATTEKLFAKTPTQDNTFKQDASLENKQTPKNIESTAPKTLANAKTSQEVPKVPVAPLDQKNATTSNLGEADLTKQITGEKTKAPDRPPVNAIEAQMASFTGKNSPKNDLSNEKITTFSPLTQNPSEMFQDMGGPAKQSDGGSKSKPKKKGVLKKLLKILITLFFLAFVGVGGYFGYKYFQDQGVLDLDDLGGGTELLDQVQDQVENVLVEEPEQETVQEKKFALEFPNYIELEDDSPNSQEFSQTIQEIAQSLPAQNAAAPISFLVTDPTGTPLTLRSFATLVDMNLPPAILDQAGDAFEIYAYENAGDVRFGIGFEYLDRQLMSNALSDNELQLPQAFTPLYNNLNVIEPTPFADNVYGNYAVRFSNFRPDESLSIDYTVADKVYVGTSQISQRAILDKFATDEIQ